MNNKKNDIMALSNNGVGVIKAAAPLSGILGTLSDIFSPIAPFAPILFFISIISFIYFYFLKVRPRIKDEKSINSEVYLEKSAKIAGFSLITAVIMAVFWGISSQYPNEGFMAGNFESVKNFQEQMLDQAIEKENKQVLESGIERKTIAVLYFDNGNNNEDLNPLRKGLADMLISDLSRLKMLRVVERDKLEEILKEISLTNSTGFDMENQQRIGKLLGAELMLFGSYFELLGTFRIDARIIKTETGEVFKSKGVNGKTENFVDLEKELVFKIAQGLNVTISDKEEAMIMEESIKYEAALKYSEGLVFYDNGYMQEAINKFEESLQLSPSFSKAKEMIDKLSNI